MKFIPWVGLVLIAVSVLAGTEFAAQAQAQPTPTIAQAEATRPGVPPASVPPSETLGWMFTLGIVSNGLMRKMRESSWFPWVKLGAGKMNVALAGMLAAVSAVGIHTEFDKAAGTVLITGLTLSGIAHFGGEWLRQWTLQQFTYQTMKSDAITGDH